MAIQTYVRCCAPAAAFLALLLLVECTTATDVWREANAVSSGQRLPRGRHHLRSALHRHRHRELLAADLEGPSATGPSPAPPYGVPAYPPAYAPPYYTPAPPPYYAPTYAPPYYFTPPPYPSTYAPSYPPPPADTHLPHSPPSPAPPSPAPPPPPPSPAPPSPAPPPPPPSPAPPLPLSVLCAAPTSCPSTAALTATGVPSAACSSCSVGAQCFVESEKDQFQAALTATSFLAVTSCSYAKTNGTVTDPVLTFVTFPRYPTLQPQPTSSSSAVSYPDLGQFLAADTVAAGEAVAVACYADSSLAVVDKYVVVQRIATASENFRCPTCKWFWSFQVRPPAATAASSCGPSPPLPSPPRPSPPPPVAKPPSPAPPLPLSVLCAAPTSCPSTAALTATGVPSAACSSCAVGAQCFVESEKDQFQAARTATSFLAVTSCSYAKTNGTVTDPVLTFVTFPRYPTLPPQPTASSSAASYPDLGQFLAADTVAAGEAVAVACYADSSLAVVDKYVVVQRIATASENFRCPTCKWFWSFEVRPPAGTAASNC